MKQLKWLLILFCCTFFNAVKSQEMKRDSIAQVKLEPIIIQSTRYELPESKNPFSVTRLNQNRIQKDQPQISIKEAIDAAPGVFALNRNNFAQDVRVSIRGFGARAAFGIRGIKVLVDGIPESTPDGQAQIDNIDIGVMDELEIVRGPSSVLYGNASGGVLSFYSEEVKQPFIETRFTTGSYGFNRLQFKSGLKKGNVKSLLYLAHTTIDGYRENSAAENTLFNNKTTIALSEKTSLDLLINYSNSPQAEDPGGLTLEEVNADRKQARSLNVTQRTGEEVEQGRIGLVLDKSFASNHKIKAKAYYTFRKFDGTIPFAIIDLNRDFVGTSLNYQFSTNIGKVGYKLIAGIDLEHQLDKRDNFDNNNGERSDILLSQNELFTTKAGYLIHQIEPSASLNITLGARFDAIEIQSKDKLLPNGDDSGNLTFDRISPMLGLTYAFKESLIGFANISQSFETPTLTELSNDPQGLGGFNTSLSPQKATNFEFGFKGNLKSIIEYQLAIFQIQVEDELVPYELGQFPDRDFYRNAGASVRNGLEFGLTINSNVGLTSYTSYTYSDFSYDEYISNGIDFSGNILPAIPKNLLFQEFRYTHAIGFNIILNARYVGEMYANDANSTLIDDFININLRLGHNILIEDWEISPFLGINNLSNSKYFGNIRINGFGERFYEPAPTFNLYGGLRIRFNY